MYANHYPCFLDLMTEIKDFLALLFELNFYKIRSHLKDTIQVTIGSQSQITLGVGMQLALELPHAYINHSQIWYMQPSATRNHS